jgi:hypothetical protein
MQSRIIHDYGVPVERAAQISGWEGGAFIHLLFQGLFGPSPRSPVSRAPLRHVAAATALKQAENAGVPRERVLPVLQQVADAIYVRLAIVELRDMRWHLATCGTTLTSRLRSGDCQSEVEELLGVQTRNTQPFAIFPPTGPLMVNSLPGNFAADSTAVHLSMERIAEQISARVPGPLFH